MNFLAHFQLAWPEDGLIAGALEGDYYKGPVGDDLPPDVAQGVRLHRAVDAYTDQHPRIKRLREEFPPGLRRCAGILIDLAFDHYLSTHWHRFSETALPEFIPAVYSSLQNQESVLSEGSRSMLSRMIEYDILTLYGDWHTVPASAERIGRRFRRGNLLLGIEPELTRARPEIEAAFLDFYPDLQKFCQNWQAT